MLGERDIKLARIFMGCHGGNKPAGSWFSVGERNREDAVQLVMLSSRYRCVEATWAKIWDEFDGVSPWIHGWMTFTRKASSPVRPSKGCHYMLCSMVCRMVFW